MKIRPWRLLNREWNCILMPTCPWLDTMPTFSVIQGDEPSSEPTILSWRPSSSRLWMLLCCIRTRTLGLNTFSLFGTHCMFRPWDTTSYRRSFYVSMGSRCTTLPRSIVTTLPRKTTRSWSTPRYRFRYLCMESFPTSQPDYQLSMSCNVRKISTL